MVLLQGCLPRHMSNEGYAHSVVQAVVQNPVTVTIMAEWKILKDRGGHWKVIGLGKHLEDARTSMGAASLRRQSSSGTYKS